jgi:hypothetical protein
MTNEVEVRLRIGALGELKVVRVPSWVQGLQAMGKVIRKLTPPEEVERSPYIAQQIERYERADPTLLPPHQVYAERRFAVQTYDPVAAAARNR